MLRQYFKNKENRIPEGLAEVVFLAPPSGGSFVTDRAFSFRIQGFIAGIMGQAFLELGTDPDSTVNALGEIPFRTLILTGNQPSGFNGLLDMFLPRGLSDGKVSIQSSFAFKTQDSPVYILKTDHTKIDQSLEVVDLVAEYFHQNEDSDGVTLSNCVNPGLDSTEAFCHGPFFSFEDFEEQTKI